MPFCYECEGQVEVSWKFCPHCNAGLEKKNVVTDNVIDIGQINISNNYPISSVDTKCPSCFKFGTVKSGCHECEEICYCDDCAYDYYQSRKKEMWKSSITFETNDEFNNFARKQTCKSCFKKDIKVNYPSVLPCCGKLSKLIKIRTCIICNLDLRYLCKACWMPQNIFDIFVRSGKKSDTDFSVSFPKLVVNYPDWFPMKYPVVGNTLYRHLIEKQFITEANIFNHPISFCGSHIKLSLHPNEIIDSVLREDDGDPWTLLNRTYFGSHVTDTYNLFNHQILTWDVR